MGIRNKLNNFLFPRRKRILFIEDRVPYNILGAGFPRSNKMLNILSDLGYKLTFYPIWPDEESEHMKIRDFPESIKVLEGENYHMNGLEEYICDNGGSFGSILISRPHNMEYAIPILEKFPNKLSKTRIIYDAEAVYALREIKHKRLKGKELPRTKSDKLISTELEFAKPADFIFTVSKQEKQHFIESGYDSGKVIVLSHTVSTRPQKIAFDQRKNILFVGALYENDTPNVDGILWFTKKVLPKINQISNVDIKLILVGINKASNILELKDKQVEIRGSVPKLLPIYNKSRIFIAPIRYGAGIPLKVIEAAAMGIPVVSTKFVADQLGWEDGKEILVTDDPKEFAEKFMRLYTDSILWNSIRDNALTRINMEYSETVFSDALRKAFSH